MRWTNFAHGEHYCENERNCDRRDEKSSWDDALCHEKVRFVGLTKSFFRHERPKGLMNGGSTKLFPVAFYSYYKPSQKHSLISARSPCSRGGVVPCNQSAKSRSEYVSRASKETHQPKGKNISRRQRQNAIY